MFADLQGLINFGRVTVLRMDLAALKLKKEREKDVLLFLLFGLVVGAADLQISVAKFWQSDSPQNGLANFGRVTVL